MHLWVRLASELQNSELVEDLPRPAPFFEFRVLNWGAANRAHCDPHDAGLTMLLILTEQADHYLCLPEVKMKIKIGNGTVVALASAYLDHFVEGCKTSKDRYSLLFISQRQTATYLKIAKPRLI